LKGYCTTSLSLVSQYQHQNITIVMSVDAKKESIRAALQELENPDSELSANAAMAKLKQAVVHDFEEIDQPLGDFVGDDDFKEEIFSARVVHVVMDVAKDTDAYCKLFYQYAYGVLHLLCVDNNELSSAFVAHGGVEFLLEALEAFSSYETLLISCFTVHSAVIDSLGKKESASFAGMTLGKLLDVIELHYKTCDQKFYIYYCLSMATCFRPGLEEFGDHEDLTARGVAYVWFGTTKYEDDEDAHRIGHGILTFLENNMHTVD
jgi:hypothetical protein